MNAATAHPTGPTLGGMSEFSHDYVVVGAGMAGAAAVRGIRRQDPDGTIALIGSEPDAPYNRTTLSKALWRDPDTTTLETIALRAPGLPGVTLVTGTTVVSLDRVAHTVRTASGDTYHYARLVVATGGRPRTGGIEPGPRTIHFHNLGDYKALRALADRGAHVVVVGGGFIGTELAAVLAASPATVTYVFPGASVGSRQFPPEITAHLDRVYAEAGVELVRNSRVASVEESADGVRVVLEDGAVHEGDAVVLGLGQEVDTGWLGEAGLEVGDGVLVDDHFRTSDPDIYAAGDIADVPDRIFGRRRIEHEDAAVSGGRAAGRNAAGGDVVDDHLPFFYSDLFESGYEALGRLDPTQEVLVDWKVVGEQLVVYYLDAERVLQGVLMWNVWGDEHHDTKAIAARLLADRSPRRPEELVGAI